MKTWGFLLYALNNHHLYLFFDFFLSNTSNGCLYSKKGFKGSERYAPSK